MQAAPLPLDAPHSPRTLLDAFQRLRRERKLRHRDAAQALGVTEAEAIAAAVGAEGALRATRLAGPWAHLFEQMPRLGPVMALTRNEHAVHEKVGRFEEMSHDGEVGLALGSAIDLRIFYSRWRHAFAVHEETERGTQRSLQIFDAHGAAIHKVFLRPESDLAAWERFVAAAAHGDQSPLLVVEPAPPAEPSRADDAIDVTAFRDAWRAMTDTHQFFPLLRRFGLTRTEALRLAPTDFAHRVHEGSARLLLQEAARHAVPIMCFVANPGMIQIHSGRVERVQVTGPWLNVLDGEFNLHLREDHIAAAWVVKKPTADGLVTSLELFADDGETIALFFGARKPGQPERPEWRALVHELPEIDA